MNYDEEILKHSPSFVDREISTTIIDTIDTANECGLDFVGIDDEGNPEFLRDDKAWEKFNQII
jgi:hypothetical protein